MNDLTEEEYDALDELWKTIRRRFLVMARTGFS
jgi:hypothetical protein